MYGLYMGKSNKQKSKLEDRLYCYKDTGADDKRIMS